MRRAALGSMIVLLLAGCSRARTAATGTPEEPWSHAYSGAPDGWWKDWDSSLSGKAPFGVGTRFEVETIDVYGAHTSQVVEVRSIRPQGNGAFALELAGSDGRTGRGSVPPELRYTRGAVGSLTTRNEKLVSVTVPAGTFAAGRMWSQQEGTVEAELDEWVVPDLPMPVQSWYRPISEKHLYNPPADGTVPSGTRLTRLVRIERK